MRFRCLLCNAPRGFEFESSEPVCTSCKRSGPMILPLVNVHWLAPHDGGTIPLHQGGLGGVACMPTRPNLMRLAATGEIIAVTCPQCRATPAFKASWAEWSGFFPDLSKEWEERQTLNG